VLARRAAVGFRLHDIGLYDFGQALLAPAGPKCLRRQDRAVCYALERAAMSSWA
jgi:hypothetical protein